MKFIVLAYHHINYEKRPDCVSPGNFESHLKILLEKGFKPRHLNEIIASPHDKDLSITFDDGYLDNWVYAFPLLKKYSIKATIFISTGRICLEAPSPRYNLEDVWTKKIKKKELPLIESHFNINTKSFDEKDSKEGFLSWEEIKFMAESGLVDIQSHGASHKMIFASPEITDYNKGQYWWIKGATGGDSRNGIPVYQHRSAIAARKFCDDIKIRNLLAGHVNSRGEMDFFKKNSWKKELDTTLMEFLEGKNLHGVWEPEEEFKERLKYEIDLSRKTIEQKLEKECSIFCYPWGEYETFTVDRLKNAGYRAAATFNSGANNDETSPFSLNRIPVLNWNSKKFVKEISSFS
ncbi:MAG: polysaccharide deacetylase family protein [Firmicutes bacterium]|nr:polysaccharide deacetylase family protein [Bacillota bacterium]